MAQRRMISIKVVDAAKFVKMPPSTRLLYYDLNIRADDDGIVEAWNVMKMTGSAEDDLRVLEAKGFVKILDEDLVTHVVDWKEHNLIRPDRKVDSIYKDLLVRVVPGIELIEPRQRADLKKKEPHEEEQNRQPPDVQWTGNGQSVDGIGKVMLGQGSVSLGEDSLSQDIKDSLPGDEPPDELKPKKLNPDADPLNKYNQAAVHFAEMVLKANPTCKVPKEGTPQMAKWAREIRLMFEADKRDREHVRETLTYCFEKDTFWSHTCQSPANFRTNYDKIRGKMLSTNKTGQIKPAGKFEQSLVTMNEWLTERSIK